MNSQTPECLIQIKQQQFNAAMAAYENKKPYLFTGRVVSAINIFFQVWLMYEALQNRISLFANILSIITAFLLADFINGFVHMLLDNSDGYTFFWGPFVAAFHLHHKTPVYKKRNVLLVYFHESGSKIWLSFYFLVVAIALFTLNINTFILYTLGYFGIFSCLAEISHYYCHVSGSLGSRFLAFLGIFMTKHYHIKHHLEDNYRYAFLNGISDPLLNFIAKRLFKGYKTTTDMHYAKYTGSGTTNRDGL